MPINNSVQIDSSSNIAFMSAMLWSIIWEHSTVVIAVESSSNAPNAPLRSSRPLGNLVMIPNIFHRWRYRIKQHWILAVITPAPSAQYLQGHYTLPLSTSTKWQILLLWCCLQIFVLRYWKYGDGQRNSNTSILSRVSAVLLILIKIAVFIYI